MSIKEQVEKIVIKRWEELRNPKNLVGLNNIEKQTNQGYNGRQLLELFQNCEDEGASKVKIHLDTENCLLEISNDGNNSFSIKGYDSILYPGLSSKVSSGYIGNKGLGFRSIINWADKISIISNDFKVIFDETLKKDILLNKIGYTEAELTEIRKERKLNSDVYPLPLLNCCKIEDVIDSSDFTTTISIRYKSEYEERIIEQLESISEKTLLFLQNINTIEIDGNFLNKTISITRKKISENNLEIVHNGQIYYVISDDGIVDENLIEDKESSEPKRYSVKIAYSNDLNFKDKVLYNYFKTQIPFELPFVAHASLELDQNRNHSTKSAVNPFILGKLFDLHLKFIEILKGKHSKSWLPFQTINNDVFSVYEPYSNIIDNYWGDFEVYPILSGKYVNSSIAKNLGNRIAEFIHKNNLEAYFGEQLVYCALPINPQQYVEKPKNYKEIIERLAINLNVAQRAELVGLLLDIYPNEQFCVLIDENKNLIKTKDYVYTDKTAENKGLEVPYYSKIRFLNPELYIVLLDKLHLQSETHKSRSLKDKLEKISDVHSFEPQTVIKKIISETTEYLKENENDKNKIIKEFYQKLFYNYKLRAENPFLDYEAEIPCLNQNDQLINIQSLVLSEEFEVGKLSKQIFDKLYGNEYTIASLETLGLENDNLRQVEEFLLWLGINPFSILESAKTNIDIDFITYCNKIYDVQINNYNLYVIRNFDEIFKKESVNINKVIAWLSLDNKLSNVFTNYTKLCSDSEKLSYNYYGQKFIKPFKNFIYYKLTQHYDIQNYLITTKKQEWFNPFTIDYEFLSNVNKALDRAEVDRILSFFGAKKDFNDLNINYLKLKTQELAERNNDKGSQVFYKNLVGHYKKNEQSMLGVDLYAKEGKDIVVKNSSQIYFSDRIQLPESLTNKFPLLYYPSRSGGARAIKMFGLKNLNNLDLKIETEEANLSISDDFEKLLKEIKPFILAFRLDKISKEDVKNDQVLLLNKLKIICCKELTCRLEDEVFAIEPYNYAYSNNQFYINIPIESSISQLKLNKQFRDNLSDIFLKVFDTLDEKKTFESIIMQSKEDNMYDVKNELAEGIFEEANILLGEISVRLSIWKTIFRIKGIEASSDLNENNIEDYIFKKFPELTDHQLFQSDDNLKELFRIRSIFSLLRIDLKEYNDVSDYKISFDKLFTKELVLFYDERKKNIKNQLWLHLSTNGKDEQINFIKYLHDIEHLLNNFSFSQIENSYDLVLTLSNVLKEKIPFMRFDLEYEDYPEYDSIESENIKHFSEDEILDIRRSEELNSLSYFEGQIDYIKSQLNKKQVQLREESNNVDFNLDINQPSELIEEFEVVINPNGGWKQGGNGLWLGNKTELSSNQKKILGNTVEEIVKKYLTERPLLYNKVELIAKTNESEHYDIKYYDVNHKQMRYVESKYYNGSSFILSRDEMEYGLKNAKQYEIWLVNKDSKIFVIKDINNLGQLQPLKYRVEIKLKEYAIQD
ncbi:MAG: sacsin N-terminal ATP-binding-like domain-containing protein [Gelidibacter sp.]